MHGKQQIINWGGGGGLQYYLIPTEKGDRMVVI